MKTIKTNTEVVNFEGEALKQTNHLDSEVLTVGVAISTVLASHTENPARCWQLGKAFATEKEVDLKAEDVVFIKEALGKTKAFIAIVTGQVIELLDSKEEEKDEKKDKK